MVDRWLEVVNNEVISIVEALNNMIIVGVKDKVISIVGAWNS